MTAPQPADETGPGSNLRVESEPASRKSPSTPPSYTPAKEVPTTTTEVSHAYPSPRQSPSSSRQSPPAHRQAAFGDKSGHTRKSSLTERFPGDMSHRPLDQLRHETAIANKSRHVTKKHTVRPDGVDQLDEAAAGGAYHHSGPYDATLWARNNSYTSSPVQAVASTNEQTIKATPKEKLIDSLERHRPLDGVAAYAPGEVDPNGHEYRYEPGENMMTDLNPQGGAYKRWPGIQYHPDDIKGKGEPSYSVEKALKKHDDSPENGVEMSDRSGSGSLGQALRSEGYEAEDGMRRRDSLTKRLSGGLKKRIGSLKKTSRHEE